MKEIQCVSPMGAFFATGNGRFLYYKEQPEVGGFLLESISERKFKSLLIRTKQYQDGNFDI